MIDLPVLNSSFGALHFGEARLGHVGRTRRLVLAADAIIQHPGGTLPQKFHEPAPLDAFYRLANRQEVTHRAVLEPHLRRTLRLIRATTDPILLIHDTTELDYTSITSLDGLGQIGNGLGRGYECHNTLAVHAPTRTVIGLAGQILARRDRAPKDETRQAGRDRATRESRLWKRGSEAIGPAPDGATWVDVCDRGADIFEYIEYKHQSGGPFIVRSKHDRLCMAPDAAGEWRRGKLHARCARLEPLGARYVPTPGREGPGPRRAKVTIAAGPVELLAPKQPRGDHGSDPVPLNLVVVREVERPRGSSRWNGSSWRRCRRATWRRRSGWSTGTGAGRWWRSFIRG